MKLYYANGSSSSRRASLVVAHLGIELEHVSIDLMKDRAKLAPLNPNGKIPVLEDGDFVLWESHAIMQYLCELVPEQTLYPAERRARADVHRWLYWTSAHLAPAVGGLSFERLWKKMVTGRDPDPAMLAHHEAALHPVVRVLDRHLAGRTWTSGEALTLADLSIAATLMYEQRASLPLAEYRGVRALVERVHALPAWRATEPA